MSLEVKQKNQNAPLIRNESDKLLVIRKLYHVLLFRIFGFVLQIVLQNVQFFRITGKGLSAYRKSS